MNYQIRILEDIGDAKPGEWNALGVEAHPFLRHEFLHALEQMGCLGERYGWLPRHISVRDDRGELLAAAPLYLKFNSYGEFVFDWSWADAYRRNGLEYYPKLVSASPYTPATGPKLLLRPGAPETLREVVEQTAMELAKASHCSSLHWLFTPQAETDWLESQGYMRRSGCQFHWHNRGWRDFDDFLASLSHAKRKSIRRERRRTREDGISFRWLDGPRELINSQTHPSPIVFGFLQAIHNCFSNTSFCNGFSNNQIDLRIIFQAVHSSKKIHGIIA